ncbi:hypothetical protein WR25_12177 [Diploscapter pachys]|uniref:Hint domain-containing protein n=1 Tax=Diploscapter pachys TaxID=2018661 RepID=A0A2A2LHB3_9BILA|nr:hypothetical protein WR25_12177 [Diploscapter pachys]
MKLAIIPFLLAKFYECRSLKTGDGLLEELARNANENVRCFSTDSWLTTPRGKKRMDQIKVGDFVLTANQTNAYFTPITMWIHRDPDLVTRFVTIMTDYGKMMALTARHLMYRNECEEFYDDFVTELPLSNETVYAENLRAGDCVILLYKGRWRQQKLQEIEITTRKGAFAPMTENGRIIVNDMLASCHSDLRDVTQQSNLFNALLYLKQQISKLFGMSMHNYVYKSVFSELPLDLLRLMVPYLK